MVPGKAPFRVMAALLARILKCPVFPHAQSLVREALGVLTRGMLNLSPPEADASPPPWLQAALRLAQQNRTSSDQEPTLDFLASQACLLYPFRALLCPILLSALGPTAKVSTGAHIFEALVLWERRSRKETGAGVFPSAEVPPAVMAALPLQMLSGTIVARFSQAPCVVNTILSLWPRWEPPIGLFELHFAPNSPKALFMMAVLDVVLEKAPQSVLSSSGALSVGRMLSQVASSIETKLLPVFTPIVIKLLLLCPWTQESEIAKILWPPIRAAMATSLGTPIYERRVPILSVIYAAFDFDREFAREFVPMIDNFVRTGPKQPAAVKAARRMLAHFNLQ